MKKTLANEKKTGIQIHPRLFRGLYNIEKGNNHRKKREKNSKMKFKKLKKKNSKFSRTGSAPYLVPRFRGPMLNPQSCGELAMKQRANLSQNVTSRQRNARIKCANILREEVF